MSFFIRAIFWNKNQEAEVSFFIQFLGDCVFVDQMTSQPKLNVKTISIFLHAKDTKNREICFTKQFLEHRTSSHFKL